MIRSWRTWIVCGALAGGLWWGPGESARAAPSTCVYQQDETQPYWLLGSLVEPSSNIIIVGACGSSYDQLNAEYVEQAPNRGTAHFGSGDCTRRTSEKSSVTCAAPRFD